jgi:hypothetical protein
MPCHWVGAELVLLYTDLGRMPQLLLIAGCVGARSLQPAIHAAPAAAVIN